MKFKKPKPVTARCVLTENAPGTSEKLRRITRTTRFEIRLPRKKLLEFFPEHGGPGCSDEKLVNFVSCHRCSILTRGTTDSIVEFNVSDTEKRRTKLKKPRKKSG
jgi:hypothetical protein